MLHPRHGAGDPYSPFSPSSAVKGSSLTSLFLAAVLPFLFLKLCSFFNHTWPNFIYRLLTSRLERQIATVAERVYPNRLIQDDIMIRSIMGYVSYCYLQSLREGPNACDAVSLADYDYTFIYENADDFDESWVPYSTHYKTLFGRIIASAMELSVLPSTGQAIQVEPGLFVRSLDNKHIFDQKHKIHDQGDESDADSDASHRAEGGEGRGSGSARLNQMDRLNRYVFYDMRKFAENMDEHPQPAADGNADDISSAERPFDSPANKRREEQENKKKRGTKSESTQCDNNENPPQENFVVIEYRRPLPYETAQALCNAQNTAGVAASYDPAHAAEDVIEGFLSRAHGWYLAHAAQCKTNPLMAIYPTPVAKLFGKNGVRGFDARTEGEGDFEGRCYVLEAATPAADVDAAAAATTAAEAAKEAATGASTIAGAAVTIGPSTLSGGHVGISAASNQSLQSRGKTFKSLFFPAKARVLSILDDFVHERGAYGVPGVVPRLNFFLHGAPGTGKTSFVKALARHLRRNLIVVSMSEILTVDELQKLLQPFELNHERNDYGNKFSVRPHQSIYVFEDFDAIGEAWVALQQNQSERQAIQEQKKKEAEAAKAAAAASDSDEEGEDSDEASDDEASESGGGTDTSGDNEEDGEGSEATTTAASSAEESGEEEEEEEETDSDATSEDDSAASDDDRHSRGSSYDDDSGSSNGHDGNSEGDSDDDCGSDTTSSASAVTRDSFLLDDERMGELEKTHLTVDRFLDLFNGLNLPDSFIAVFTTNHPENVHPAITSSNMMDVTLDMGMLSETCALEMVEHYFVDELTPTTADARGVRHLTRAQVTNLQAALAAFNETSDGLSGAMLEKMCIECDTVEALTQRLLAADTWDAINAF